MKIRFKIYLALLSIAAFMLSGYALWEPGEARLKDGRNFTRNGLWISHGWFGDSSWFDQGNIGS
jgi:hypothetical protein